jgi:thioredoxin-related protein
MQTRLGSMIEMAANFAIFVAAFLFSLVLIKSYLIPATPKNGESTSAPVTQRVMQNGDNLNVPSLAWPQDRRTLLLAVSTTCHFCTDSAPFYQRISKDHGNAHLVALLPQDKLEAEKYLAKLGVKVDEIRQASLGELGITGTPTLALIDSSGKVLRTWEGVLTADKEQEVISQLKEETIRSQ